MVGKWVIDVDLTFSSIETVSWGKIFHMLSARQNGERDIGNVEVLFSYHVLGDFSLLCGPGNSLTLSFELCNNAGDNLGAVYSLLVFWGWRQ